MRLYNLDLPFHLSQIYEVDLIVLSPPRAPDPQHSMLLVQDAAASHMSSDEASSARVILRMSL